MEYRVEDLAHKVGLSVDTIRYYQGIGVLHSPRKKGRCAYYDDAHVRQIKRIKELSGKGFPLALIKRLSSNESAQPDNELQEVRDSELLAALVQESVGPRSLTISELASNTGIPESLIRVAQSSGLVEPTVLEGKEHYSEADAEMLRSAVAILEAGFPMEELLSLASEHAENIRNTADRAIELFRDYVKGEDGRDGDYQKAVSTFNDLLPKIVRLVAIHFQRTLVNRALARMTAK